MIHSGGSILLANKIMLRYYVITTKRWLWHAAVLDVVFTWKARNTMNITEKRKYLLKVIVAVIWTIILPVYYTHTRRKYTCSSKKFGSWQLCYSSYMVAVLSYLMTNAIEMVLFFVPAISRYIETSNFRICTFLSWWTQVLWFHPFLLNWVCYILALTFFC